MLVIHREATESVVFCEILIVYPQVYSDRKRKHAENMGKGSMFLFH
jgi:hypothetical protein